MNIDDEKEFFHQATLRICGSLEIEQAMMKCFRYLKDFIPMDEMTMNRYDPALFAVRCVVRVTGDSARKINRIIPVPRHLKDHVMKREEGTQHVVIINRPDQEPVRRLVWDALDMADSSFLVVHLSIEGVPLGGVVFRSSGYDRYTEEHGRLLGLLHDPFAIAAANTHEHEEVLRLKDLLNDENRYLKNELRRVTGDTIIGAEFGLRHVMEMVEQAGPKETSVLLLGETGVGKELIANAIHFSSSRKDGPFIKVNCGAIPEALIDSELFGHEKGAFTGAVTEKRGRFERAHGGTIFLDEIGDLPLQAQIRLLRVLQHKEIERVGGTGTISLDIRVIAATHRNLESMVADGTFREDLWYRLSVFPIRIPPLRQRREDIPNLVDHFVRRKSGELKLRTVPTLAPGAIDRLTVLHWKGNVRELENVVERALIQYKGGALTFDPHTFTLTEETGASGQPDNGPLGLNDVIAGHIERVLRMTGGKINGTGGAAELLGIHANTLRNRMNKLGISYGRKIRALSASNEQAESRNA